MIIDDMSDIMDKVFLSVRDTYENDDHRCYIRHYGPSIYISNTQTERMIIIDHIMSNIRDMVFMYGIHKLEE